MESPSAAAAARAFPLTPKLRLMCSYGGHIVPRPHDKSLCYVGGDTRIVVVGDRQLSSISALCSHLAKSLLDDRPFVLKYQLPNEDLDALVTVSTDEDLENMIEESVSSSLKHPRIRLFLFPPQPAPPESSRSIGRILEASGNWEDWFLDALNSASTVGADKGFSDYASVNCLLGLEDAGIINGESGLEKTAKQPQEVQSVPDSPMLATSSSFGSTSTASSHSVVNSPPIRVQSELEAARDEKLGIEEQFALMGVGIGVGQKQEDGSVASSAPPLMPATSAECVHRVFSDDERLYQGVPVNSQKLGRQQPQLQSLPHNVHLKSQQSSGLNSHSADSLSSESIWTNTVFFPNPVNYQELIAQLPPANKRIPSNQDDEKVNASDLISQVHLRQQTPDANHLFPSQSDQQQPEHHPPLPQQQFLQATSHFIPLQPTGGAQLTAYYSQYPPSHQNHQYYHPQHNQQFPVYYVRAAHDLAAQQPNISEASATAAVPSSQPQMPPNLVRDSPVAKPHQQFAGYSPVHHQSRSYVAPATYGSEHVDPAHMWKYGGQPMVPMLYSHYQPPVASNNLFFSEGSAQLSGDKIRQQMQVSKPF